MNRRRCRFIASSREGFIPSTEARDLRLSRHSLSHNRGPHTVAAIAVLLALLTVAPWAAGNVRAQEGEGVATLVDQPPYITGSAEGGIPRSIGRNVAWRVVRDVGEPTGQAGDEVRALGFGVPLADPLRTTNVETGNVARFHPGQIFYVIEDSTTRRESLSQDSVPYTHIALIPEDEVMDAGGDTLFFAGRAFSLPFETSDLNIRASAYEIGEGDRIPFGGYRTVLVHAVAGSISYEAIDGQSGPLLAGESATVVVPDNGGPDANRVDIIGRDPNGSRYVVAMVDPPSS